MSLQAQIDTDIKDAMRSKQTDRLGLLRMLKSALKYAAIEDGGAGAELGDEAVQSIIRKEIKKRRDSIESFTKGGRPELAEKEAAEISVLEEYLPQPLTAEELAEIVRESIAEAGATSRQQTGAVMKLANAKAAGRAEGRALSAEVQKQLS